MSSLRIAMLRSSNASASGRAEYVWREENLGRSRVSLNRGSLWMSVPLSRVLLNRKFGLSVVLTLYYRGSATTSEVIRTLRGHPATIISTLRILEDHGVLTREMTGTARTTVVNRLTLAGVQLIETPIHLWDRVLRKWDRFRILSGKQNAAMEIDGEGQSVMKTWPIRKPGDHHGEAPLIFTSLRAPPSRDRGGRSRARFGLPRRARAATTGGAPPPAARDSPDRTG